jgi:hypothetical protein
MCFSLLPTLFSTKSAPQSLLNVPEQWITIGSDGIGSSWSTAFTLTRGAGKIRSLSSKYLSRDITTEDLCTVKTPSKLTWWRMPCMQSVRYFPYGGRRASLKISLMTWTSVSPIRYNEGSVAIAIAVVITITCYYLLFSVKYTGTPSDGTSFHLKDITLYIQYRWSDSMAAAPV